MFAHRGLFMDIHAVTEFLKESNRIENVWDNESLLTAERAWAYTIAQEKITPHVIKKMHGILMEGKLPENEVGEFRTCSVYVGRQEKAKFYAVPGLIENWCIGLELSRTEEDIQNDHVKYEEIHPFTDGNGRTGRILYNWQRLKLGFSLSIIYEKNKHDYYKWFKEYKL